MVNACGATLTLQMLPLKYDFREIGEKKKRELFIKCVLHRIPTQFLINLKFIKDELPIN